MFDSDDNEEAERKRKLEEDQKRLLEEDQKRQEDERRLKKEEAKLLEKKKAKAAEALEELRKELDAATGPEGTTQSPEKEVEKNNYIPPLLRPFGSPSVGTGSTTPSRDKIAKAAKEMQKGESSGGTGRTVASNSANVPPLPRPY